MKLVFMGTPEFAVPTLDAIVAAGHQVVCVFTQPARVAGRGHKARKTPVHLAAGRHGLDLETPDTFRTAAAAEHLAALKPDAAVVVAYGQILPQAVLDTPVHGCFNLHASLLPRWRGAAPIHRAIMAGDTQSGVCVMQMSAGLDEGPVCLSHAEPLDDKMTTGDLHDVLATAGAKLMVRALAALEDKTLCCEPQTHDDAVYARKITKAEARINFAQPARTVLRHIHGLSPFPGAWFTAQAAGGQSIRIKVLRCELASGKGEPGDILDDYLTIACRDGAIRPVLLQREGKAPMQLNEFLRGNALAPNSQANSG